MFRHAAFYHSIMKLIHCGPVAAAKGGLPAGWKRGEKEKGGGRRRKGPEVKW